MRRKKLPQSSNNDSDNERQLDPTADSVVFQLAAALRPSSNGSLNGFGSLEESILSHTKQSTNGGYHPGEPPQLTAKKIRDTLTPTCLTESALNKSWSPLAWYLYCQKILVDAGAIDDPVLQMMVEQTTMAHHALQRMFVAVASPQSPEQAECLYAAIPRLLAEVRRMALAIKEYQAPSASKVVNVVQQQNLAAGDQQVAFLAGPSDAPANAQVQPSEKDG